MKLHKAFATLAVCLMCFSCGKGGQEQSSDSKNSSQEKETFTQKEQQLLAESFQINTRMFNFNDIQKMKVYEATALIKKVVASEEFRQEILNYTFAGKKQFHENRGFSNAEIYQQILEGSETVLESGKNNVMDLELQLYYENTSTIGYTYPDVVRIYMNAKFFDNFTPVQVSDNLIHEWLHKLGYDHDMVYSPSRDHTVPYAIGYIMKRLAKKYYSPSIADI